MYTMGTSKDVVLWEIALVRTDVSGGTRVSSIIRVTRIGELGTTLALTSNRSTLRRSNISILTRATRRKIPEDGLLYSHRLENPKFYIALTGWVL
jgi:hypothetical protein